MKSQYYPKVLMKKLSRQTRGFSPSLSDLDSIIGRISRNAFSNASSSRPVSPRVVNANRAWQKPAAWQDKRAKHKISTHHRVSLKHRELRAKARKGRRTELKTRKRQAETRAVFANAVKHTRGRYPKTRWRRSGR